MLYRNTLYDITVSNTVIYVINVFICSYCPLNLNQHYVSLSDIMQSCYFFRPSGAPCSV